MRTKGIIFYPIILLWALPAAASSGGVFHHTTLLLVAAVAAAKFMGVLCEKAGFPALIGEIAGGIVLGNLALVGVPYDFAQGILHSEFFQYASELGVVFLLFLVGLESNLTDLMKAGFNSMVTATIGVILPTLGGFVFAKLLGIGGGMEGLLIGATFAATSVGITAKLLSESGKIKTPSAQIVLGAAVVDDVQGLILLAALAGVASTGTIDAAGLFWIVAKVVLFFAGAIFYGRFILPRNFKLYPKLEQPGMLTIVAVLLALLFADIAYLAGLAPIVGAFTAGLLLDEVKLRYSGGLKTHDIQDAVKPISDLLLPVFFVSIGVQVRLATLFDAHNLLLVGVLLVVAVASKAVCGMACRGKGIDKLGVGLGMIPRGEVGLIFASFGLQQKIVSPEIYSILVFVVLMTTVLGPLFLKRRIGAF